jgi:hypothetical protein
MEGNATVMMSSRERNSGCRRQRVPKVGHSQPRERGGGVTTDALLLGSACDSSRCFGQWHRHHGSPEKTSKEPEVCAVWQQAGLATSEKGTR